MTDYQNDETGSRNQRMLPWLITATVSVIAIITAMVFVTLVKAADQVESELGAGQTQSPEPEATGKPETERPTTTPEPSKEPEEEPSTTVPKVEVGPTGSMVVAPWGVSLEVPSKLGYTSWAIPSGEELMFEFANAQDLPDSCNASKTGWGIARSAQPVPGGFSAGGQNYSLLKPTACKADKAGYDQIWGLADATMRSITAM